ncbi:polyprenol phosphomannose-dependent alpha 1,6 mannosyltransferase MptB [Thalassiella azotivora]
MDDAPTPPLAPAHASAAATRTAAVLLAVSLTLLLVVALAGESAAVPGLGPAAGHPAWSADLGWGSGVVTLLLVAAYVAGAAGVATGLLALRRGAVLDRRAVVVAAVVVGTAVAVVPPVGSGDHLNYAAYGRIAAAGDDPYVDRPTEWRDGRDPVASASEPPWTGTRSIYGPVATTLQAAASHVGGDSLRLTVWAWHLLVVAAWAVTAWALDALARRGPPGRSTATARGRVALLWTLNPLVVGPAVLGSHLDTVGVALVVLTLLLLRRSPVLAGAALGAAVGVKLPFALVGLAVVWGLRLRGGAGWARTVGLGLVGAAVVLVPAHLWAGAHVYDQLERARRYVSLATPWRPVADALDPSLGTEPTRALVGAASVVVAAVLAVLLARAVRSVPAAGADAATTSAVRATWVLGAAWLLTAPYALPWYDVLVWAPLALLGATATTGWLDGAVLARATVLAVAYVPGRVVGLSPQVEQLTLAFRADVAPWLVSAAVLTLAVRSSRPGTPLRRGRDQRPVGARRAPSPRPDRGS